MPDMVNALSMESLTEAAMANDIVRSLVMIVGAVVVGWFLLHLFLD